MSTQGLGALFSLEGRTAVVTGGTGGIGSMIARGFLMAGAKVFITGRSATAAREMADKLGELGDCRPIVGDISSAELRDNLVQEILSVAPDLSILVNNAGISGTELMGECKDSTFDAVFEVNFKAVFMTIQSLLPTLKANASAQRPAHIINVGSIGGIATYMPGSYAYCPLKAALHHLTQGLGRQLAPQHVNVNAIAPGVFPTKMATSITEDADVAAQTIQMTPSGRWGEADDMGSLAVSIAANRYMVGTIIPIDGGLSLVS